jgi:hypothetical protein
MNINKLIKDTLTPLGYPVGFRTYEGKETTYITFFVYLETGENWAENEEINTGYYIQVDVFSGGDYIDLVNSVQEAMLAAGFKRTTAQDLYESDTKTFHKAIRFSYVD